MPRLIVPISSPEQLKHLFKAEDALAKAGVHFDRGSDLKDGKVLTRCWELDWSLEGAELRQDAQRQATS